MREDTEAEIKRTKALAALNTPEELEKAKLLFKLLPQGPGSGLNADMVDGLHADEIIAKAKPLYAGGGGGGAGEGMKVHGNEYHEPDFAEAEHTHTESEITDLDHDAQKIKAKTVDDSGIGDKKLLVYNATGTKLEYKTLHVITTLTFAVVGSLAVGTDKAPTILAPCSLTITKVKLVVKTAPTGASIIVDVNKNGTTIFTTQANRPSIAAGATTGDSGTPDVTSLAEGDKLTIDIDQVGSGTAGADLTVEVLCTQNVRLS